MAYTMLVDQRSKPVQPPLLKVLWQLSLLLRRRRLFQLSEISTRLCIEFAGVKWNMHIEIYVLRFRVGSEPVASASKNLDF
jgi:hypothetical protein